MPKNPDHRAKPYHRTQLEDIDEQPPTQEEIELQDEIDRLFAWTRGKRLPFLSQDERRLEKNATSLRNSRAHRGPGRARYVSGDLPSDLQDAGIIGRKHTTFDENYILKEK